ncbi:MAG: hypothetical protein GWN62_01920, partial [Aliifodinibius sp.]|nr:hypothetical protein [Fodinibius sp.]
YLHPRPQELPINEVQITPKEAVRIAEHSIGSELKFTRISLRNFKRMTIYELQTKKGKVLRVDAAEGKFIPMNKELATKLVAEHFPTPLPRISDFRQIKDHDLSYPAGPLPAYRFEFEHKHGFESHVAIKSGAVSHNDHYTRIRNIIVGLHDLSILRLLFKDNIFYRFLLILLAGISSIAALSGFYLATMRKRKRA